MNDEPDEKLLRESAAGDPGAFRALLDRHEGRVYRSALSLTRSPDWAADVCQDVFLVLLRAPDSYDPAVGPLGSFLLGIARNRVLKELRRRRRESAADAALGEPAAGEPATDEALVRAEELGVVSSAIAQLSPAQRQVVALRFQEGMALAEAAAVTLEHLPRGFSAEIR